MVAEPCANLTCTSISPDNATVLPRWLHVVARGEVWLDFVVVLAFFVATVAGATKLYPRAIL